MLKSMKLSTHLLFFFLFLEILALIMGGISLGSNHRLNNRISTLDQADIPLITAVSEMSREQLNQTLRMNEIFLYGEMDEREKFEVANNGFINAGKRLTNILVEARHITQKGLEGSNSESKKKILDKVKTIIGEFQKIHGGYEHLAGNIIRNQYKYRFLTRAGIITGNDEQTLDDAEANYTKQLGKNISDMDDETKRLENKLKEAFYATKEMVRGLASQASMEKNIAWSGFFVAMTIFTIGGFVLAIIIGKIHLKRHNDTLNAQRKLISPFKAKADLMEKSLGKLDDLLSQIAVHNNKQADVVKTAQVALTSLGTLTNNNATLSTQTALLSQESDLKAKQSDQSVLAFKEQSSRSMGLAARIHKGLHDLVQLSMQVNLLATSASAEASRKEASRGFIIFTNEIKELAQHSVKSIEIISELVERDIKEIKAGYEQVELARKTLSEVMGASIRLSNGANRIEEASQKQSGLTVEIKREATQVQRNVIRNSQLLRDSNEMCGTLRSQSESLFVTLDKLVLWFDNRRANERRTQSVDNTEEEVTENRQPLSATKQIPPPKTDSPSEKDERS